MFRATRLGLLAALAALVFGASAPAQRPPTPPSGGLCCCRTWARGWQYSWSAASQCATQNGTCVSPDHCGS
ncbi:MAG: hypothetical protein JNK72_14215 [Myxococcales bacterium]|nr:hypothetical protein [Myxococcales bacterium]